MRGQSLVVITDLDGTLLDHETYAWKPAVPALRELARRRIPLILCTSKTRAEVESLRRKLRIHDPFITENGGGLFIPRDYFRRRTKRAPRSGLYRCVALARPYAAVAANLAQAAARAGIRITRFDEMSAREISRLTGLALNDARRAQRRDFDVPFFIERASTQRRNKLISLARRRGLTIVRGSRLWHAHRGSDKGHAVRLLLAMCRKAWRSRVGSVGLGDAANDLSLLAEVDVPVLLPGPNGIFDRAILRGVRKVLRGRAPGPRGWNLAVLKILRAEQRHAATVHRTKTPARRR